MVGPAGRADAMQMRDGPHRVLANERHPMWTRRRQVYGLAALTNEESACKAGEAVRKSLFRICIRVAMEDLLFTLRKPRMAFIASLDSMDG